MRWSVSCSSVYVSSVLIPAIFDVWCKRSPRAPVHHRCGHNVRYPGPTARREKSRRGMTPPPQVVARRRRCGKHLSYQLLVVIDGGSRLPLYQSGPRPVLRVSPRVVLRRFRQGCCSSGAQAANPPAADGYSASHRVRICSSPRRSCGHVRLHPCWRTFPAAGGADGSARRRVGGTHRSVPS